MATSSRVAWRRFASDFAESHIAVVGLIVITVINVLGVSLIGKLQKFIVGAVVF